MRISDWSSDVCSSDLWPGHSCNLHRLGSLRADLMRPAQKSDSIKSESRFNPPRNRLDLIGGQMHAPTGILSVYTDILKSGETTCLSFVLLSSMGMSACLPSPTPHSTSSPFR